MREWPGGPLAPQTVYQAELVASFVLFEGGLRYGWLESASDWIELNKKGGNASFAALGRSDWDDYRLEVNMARIGSRVGAIVRYNDFLSGHNQWTFKCYRLQINLNNEWIKLDRFTGIYDENFDYEQLDVKVLWECSGAACDVDFLSDSFDAIIECVGTALTVSVNGILLATVTDPAPLRTGKAGLYYLGNQGAGEQPNFSELVIRSAPRQAVHSWAFTTSRYEGFVEHIDSFEGIVHREEIETINRQALNTAADNTQSDLTELYQAYDTARSELSTASESDVVRLRDEVHAAADAWHTSAHAHFDTLDQIVLGGGYRPLPPVVELSEIVHNTERYALLLESPEPIDWSRTELVLSQWDATATSYKPVRNMTMAWSTDGTRAYLLPDSQGRLDHGDYVIQLSYRLDNGLEAPLLRRSGSTLPEVATLFFELTA